VLLMYRLNCSQNYRLKVVLPYRAWCPSPLVVALMVSMVLLLAPTVLVTLWCRDRLAPCHHCRRHDCRQQD
jgi:hypothetical protein